MKSLIAALIVFIFSCIGTNAQKPVMVTEDTMDFGKSHLPSLAVTIPEANYETVMKAWKKELESVSKSKIVATNQEVTMYGAKLKSVSPNPVNVYSKLEPADSAVNMSVAFEQQKDEYLDKTAGLTFTKAKDYLKNFAKNQYLDVAQNQADVENKKLHDLEKQLSSLEKDKEKLQKSIASDSSELFRENENVKMQKNELASISNEVVEQSKAPASDPVGKEKTDYIKSLDKRKNKALNEIEDSQNKINKLNNQIQKNKTEIPKNEQAQAEINKKIAVQKPIADKYDQKVKTIKSF